MTYKAFKITCMKFASKFDVKNARFCYEQVGCWGRFGGSGFWVNLRVIFLRSAISCVSNPIFRNCVLHVSWPDACNLASQFEKNILFEASTEERRDFP